MVCTARASFLGSAPSYCYSWATRRAEGFSTLLSVGLALEKPWAGGK